MWVEAGLTNMLDDPVVRGVVCHLHLSVSRLARERAEERVAQLQQALDTRVIIEQAKGFLTGRDGVLPDVGFERLRPLRPWRRGVPAGGGCPGGGRRHHVAAGRVTSGWFAEPPELGTATHPRPGRGPRRLGPRRHPSMAFAAGRCYQGGVAPFPGASSSQRESAMRDVPRTYRVLCSHLGSAWAVRIPELDREAAAARLSQVEAVARALVSTYAGDDTGAADFTVELMPDALSAALAAAAAARKGTVRSPAQELLTRRRLARELYVEGLEVADIGAALGGLLRSGPATHQRGGRARRAPGHRRGSSARRLRPRAPPPRSRPRRPLHPAPPPVTDQRPAAARREP